MTEPSPDPPFPGAHSQVPGAHADLARRSPPVPAAPSMLPLDATPARSENGWVVRLPVRAEQVTVRKQVVVRERVLIRRRVVRDVAHVQAEVLHERLRVDTHGPVDVSTASGPPRRDAESGGAGKR